MHSHAHVHFFLYSLYHMHASIMHPCIHFVLGYLSVKCHISEYLTPISANMHIIHYNSKCVYF